MPVLPELIDDQLITDVELERLLKWGSGTAAVRRCKGTLPFAFYRVGKRGIRYKLSDISAYLESAKVEPKN